MHLFLSLLLLIHFISNSCPDEIDYLPQPPAPVPEKITCNAAWDPQQPSIYPDDFDGEPDDPSPDAAQQPSGHQSGGSDRTPMRIQYIITPSTTRENEHLLRKAFLNINKKLTDILKAPVLNDIRFTRFRVFRGDACHFPQTCAKTLVPAEFNLPCIKKINGQFRGRIVEKHVPIVTPEMVRYLNQENVNTVAYVSVLTKDLAKNCSRTSLAFASVGYEQVGTTFPSHGKIAFCTTPVEMRYAKSFSVLLHETLHILSAINVLGYMAPQYLPASFNSPSDRFSVVNRKAVAENLTWRKYTHKWKRSGGATEEFTTHMAITPNVFRVVREYFNCVGDVLPGAEIGRKMSSGGVRVLDDGHFSERLFPDEILSPLYNHGQVISRLTLAMLKDTGWYDVDMSKAEPLEYDVANRPQYPWNMCYVALKSCDDIFDIFRLQGERAYTRTVPWVGAYCDPSGEIATRACTHDGTTRLLCLTDGYYTDGCPVYIMKEDMDSRPMQCDVKTVHPSTRALMERHRLSFICVSFPTYYLDVGRRLVGIKTTDTPRCMMARCDRTNRGFRFYTLKTTYPSPHAPGSVSLCDSTLVCRQNNDTALRMWHRQCAPPVDSSTQVCPYYPDVCEAPGGAGAPPSRLMVEKKEEKVKETSGSIRIDSFSFELGILMLLGWYLKVRKE